MFKNNFQDIILDFYKDEHPNGPLPKYVRSITLQVTDDCTCRCSYCYQINKHHNLMTKETAREIIDLLFSMYEKNEQDAFINHDTIGIILDFIGGEPLMNISVINYACEYYLNKCIETNSPWLYNTKFSICSNGDLFFNPEVQTWLKKFKNFISINITIDGPKDIHNKCRVHPDGSGNFDNAYKAFEWLQNNHFKQGTKVTISPDNLYDINKTAQFFIDLGSVNIFGNPINEHNWTYEEATIYYKELIKMADYLLQNSKKVYVSFFDDFMFKPKKPEDLQCFCGGSGQMLAFDPDGKAYPCLRYMASSLGNSQPPIIIGNTKGVYQTIEEKETYKKLLAVNRRTKSTDECFYCPIAEGCSDCAAWNYQESGNFNCKSMNICNMHKARSLANVYYWNNYYRQNNINKIFSMNLPKQDALKIIDEQEYNNLLELTKKRD